MKDTTIVFMGTPDFAVAALYALSKTFNVVAVVTQPDKPAGRGKKLTPSPVKLQALQLHIPVMQPQKIREQSFVDCLKTLAPDYIVTAAYGKILPRSILTIPKKGALNIHASLLPAYRGSAPIHRAVMNGEKTSGITIMQMDEGMDTGDILLMQTVSIEASDTTGILHDKLAEAGAELIVRAISELNQDKLLPRKQEHDQATYAPPLERSDERIDWCADTSVIHNLVRGLNPWPGAYTEYNGMRLKIWEGEPAPLNGTPCGTVIAVEKEGIVVATGNGAYRIHTIQLPGKKKISAGDFLRGNPITPGFILGNYHAL